MLRFLDIIKFWEKYFSVPSKRLYGTIENLINNLGEILHNKKIYKTIKPQTFFDFTLISKFNCFLAGGTVFE